MGWSSGTEIFDTVVKDVLENKSKNEIIKNLLGVLTDADWDTINESKYFNDPIVLEVIKEKFPEWFDEEN